MNNDLKKVGLVFKADGTTDFIKSLQNINGSLKENYSQFKLVQAQWDSSTKTSDKLKSKLDYLNSAYDLQKDKVNLLKSELSELEKAEEKDTQAIQKKKNQLIQAETKLAKYKNQIKTTTLELKTSTNHLVIFGNAFDEASKKIESASKKVKTFSLMTGGGLVASIKSAIDFESAFAGVSKTVDATDQELEELRQGILDMSTELPASTTEISAVAEAAGQLGIQTDSILSFTKTMIDLGEATNMSADEAADALARFANITGMSQDNFDKLGSTLVELGNKSASTESEIVEMALRIAGAGTTIGMSEADIMSFAAAISSVGIEAEMGGSAFSKMMIEIESAVSQNSESLKDYASVAGMTAQEFKEAWEKDATSAMVKFVEGLGNVEKNGGNLINTLSDLGIEEVRLRDTMLRTANASELFADTVRTGNSAWVTNNALTKETDKRYATLKSRIEIVINKLKEQAITVGTKLMPSVEKIVSKIGDWIDKFSELSDEQVDFIVKAGLFVTALSPVLSVTSKITNTISGTIKAVNTFSQALQVTQGTITSTNTTVNSLAHVFSAISSPIGIVCATIAGSIGLISIATKNTTTEAEKDFKTMGDAAVEFLEGIESAESHLSDFNSTLFASVEEQQQLTENMYEIQKGITTIAETASNERREYTQSEIDQLDSYFEKLRELKDKELAIQQQIASAITLQAQTASESFSGSLEEYKVLSQEWIKTAQEQADTEIALIEQRTIEEIALLNVRYGEQATLQNEAYAKEYEAIIQKKEQAIAQANEEVGKVNEIYANGYTAQASQNAEFFTKIAEANAKLETENTEHANRLKEIQKDLKENTRSNNEEMLTSERKKAKEFNNIDTEIAKEKQAHKTNVKAIWEEMYKDMSESEAKQLGSWLAMVAQTEMYGGELSEETKEIVDSILDSYDSMPSETRKSMKQAMDPMLEAMQEAEPSLFEKASGIANGILNRLRKAFDIHSPSRKTREIFKNVMKGSELGLKDEEKNLYKQTDRIASNVLEKIDNMNGNLNSSSINSNEFSSNAQSGISNYYLTIDYNLLTKAIIKALKSCKLSIDSDGFARFIENVVYEVM